ncbi:tubulin epsilon and delta complex protein 1 [Pholidichthys leucotaenia]
MKRSVEVKKVIGSLCSLLTASGLKSVPGPETFRRAKFGAGEKEEDQFWLLLADILQTADIISCDIIKEPTGASECRKLVAAGLWRTGYYADWMYGSQSGRSFCSRDLLVALGWLLATGALEKLVTLRVQQLDRTLLMAVPVTPRCGGELQLSSASLRRLQWLNGRRRHQGRTLLSMLTERTRLLHAVLSAGLSSSSCGQDSAALKEDRVCARQLCDLLEAYLKWRQTEDVFWIWMDSVVDCHLTVTRSPAHAANHSPVGDCLHGNQGLEKLNQMLLRWSTAQGGPRRTGADVKDPGGQMVRDGIDPSSSPPPLHSFPQVCRVRLRAKMVGRHSSRPAETPHGRTGPPPSWSEIPNELQVSEATELLLHGETLLLERRETQRRTNRARLQEVVGRLETLVLIPP